MAIVISAGDMCQNSSPTPLFYSQNLVKEKLKNKEQRVGGNKADSATDVAEVSPKMESKKGGEKLCLFSCFSCKSLFSMRMVHK